MDGAPVEVVFLDADGPSDSDGPSDGGGPPRLPAPPPAGRRPLVLGMALVVGLAGAAVLARGTNRTAAPRPMTSATAPVAIPPSPKVTWESPAPLPALRRPVPRMRLVPTPGCPGGCAVLAWVADASLHALEEAFPHATVRQQMTAFAPGRFGADHPLLAREVVAAAGPAEVIIDVVQRPDPGRDLVSTKNTAVTIVRRGRVTWADATVPGYRIVVRVTGGGRAAANRLRVLLIDPGLMSVR